MRRFTLIMGLIGIAVLLVLSTGAAQAQTGVTVLTLNDLRLRHAPNAKADVIATVPAGTTLNASARTAPSDWVRVEFRGQTGWLYTSQLRIKGNFSSLPIGETVLTPISAGSAGAPQATPTVGPPPDGTIESLTQYASTDRVNYYHLVYWSDGLRVTGFYAEPKGYDKHPVVIYNRGGNRGVGALTGFELVPFAETGFVTIATQYRGVLGGEGQEQFGGADVHDVLNLIPLLKSRSSVDPDRMVMFGASRGGMMTYLALKAQAQSGANDIKAAVTVSGVADLFMWDSEHPDLTRGLYSELIGATPSTNAAPFADRSATYWPELIRVPLLIEHGDADVTVSIRQSAKLYKLLKAQGAVVEFVAFPGDRHGLPNNLAGLPEAFKWFQKYVAKPGESFDFAAHNGSISQGYQALKGSK